MKSINAVVPLDSIEPEDNACNIYDKYKFKVALADNGSRAVIRNRDLKWVLEIKCDDACLEVNKWKGGPLTLKSFHTILDGLFSMTGVSVVKLSGDASAGLPVMRRHWSQYENALSITRVRFYQIREAWLAFDLWPVCPEEPVSVEGGETLHPLRHQLPDGILYRRYIPALDKVFELRRATVEQDGESFHRWQNDPRVARFWEYPFDRKKLDEYLENCRNDAHSDPLIGSFDGAAFAYIESYWVIEDRLGPYCDALPFDQGFHMLVGERSFLGGGITMHWINAVCHYHFLLEPRTQSLWGEPRADNQALLKLLRRSTWEKLHEFDFPHKRAALLKCSKEDFFNGVML